MGFLQDCEKFMEQKIEKKKEKEFDNLYACNKLKQENTTNNKVKKIINKNNDDIGLKEIIRKEVKLVLATKTDV